MPREAEPPPLSAARALAVAALLAATLLVPPTAAAPSVEGLIEGVTVSPRFEIAGDGQSFEGGAFDWTLVCADCLVRITIETPDVTVAQDGAVTFLAPGAYEIREFRGTIMHSGERGHYDVLLLGSGDVSAL